MKTNCSECEAELATPLVCEACGALQVCAESPTPFAVMGLEPGPVVDHAALKKRLLELSRAMHPDFFGGASEEQQQLAIDNTAELNSAFELLSDDMARADWLVRSLGGPKESDERQMPQAFLIEVMEWNELLEEARDAEPGSKEHAAAHELGATLENERKTIMQAVRDALTPLPESGSTALIDIRKQMNAVRYVDRALAQLAELALEANH